MRSQQCTLEWDGQRYSVMDYGRGGIWVYKFVDQGSLE